MANNYWTERQAKAQTAITDKNIADLNKAMSKLYRKASKDIIKQFEDLYNEILARISSGEEITANKLLTMDKYWQMQAQLNRELQKLGEDMIDSCNDRFVKEYEQIYKSISLPSDLSFNRLDTGAANQVLQQVWAPDGLNLSSRIWKNQSALQETLTDELINCVASGKKTTQLKRMLIERFNVSYNRANTLVRTEIAHIEIKSAADRYQDLGITQYKFLGRDEHDIGCNCKKLNGKVFSFTEAIVGVNMPPLHPNCRCAINPIITNNET